MDDENTELLNMLMAKGFVLEVFMLQMSLEVGRAKADPQAWARNFVSTMHARIDANELTMDDRRYPVHELARQDIDRLGKVLAALLTLPPEQKP